MQRINKTKSWFFEKINKIEKTPSKIRSEKGEITTNTKEIQGIIRDYLRTYIQINWKI
jgi:hypothetical protein